MNANNTKVFEAIVEEGLKCKYVLVGDTARAAGVKVLDKNSAILVAERAAEALNERFEEMGSDLTCWRVVLDSEVTPTHRWFDALAVTCCDFD